MTMLLVILFLGVLPIVFALVRFHYERRSFFGGLTLSFGIFVLIFFGIVNLINALAGLVPESDQSIFIFAIIGAIALPLVLGFVLIINSRIMQLKEGRSLTAQLSAIFGGNAFVVIGLAGALLFWGAKLNPILRGGLFFLLTVDLSLTGIFIGYLFYAFIYQLMPVKGHIDYIITLGAGVRSEELTPLLKSRVDKGLEYYRRQNNTGKMVPSGGQGPDEPVSEAFAMAKYMREQQHVEPKHIIIEDQSTNTLENMKFSKQKIMADWQGKQEPKVIFSTNNYHVLRSAIYAKRAGLKADGVGAPTSFYFLPSASIRECIAILMMYKWFTVGMITFWALISILIAIR